MMHRWIGHLREVIVAGLSLSINLMTGTDERPEIFREVTFATDESQRLYTLRIIVNLDRKRSFIITSLVE